MKLILIRHGIAEDRNLEKSDELRELTPKGRRQLEENVAFLAFYLRDETVGLISSPLLRSVQTAQILSKAGLGKSRPMEFVATGNLSPLKRIVKFRPEVTYVIIGHSPYLEEWVFDITCQGLEMKKGSACQIEITDPESFTGFITWHLKLRDFSRLIEFDSFTQAQQAFREDIEAIIEKYRRIILEHREIYLKEPEEIESVHKLRVKIRQFRSLVSFFRPFMNKKQYRAIQDILRAMAQECAYLRELDVLIKEWRSRNAEFAQAGVSGEHFLAIMEQERGLEQNRLYGYLEKPSFAQVLNDVEKKTLEAIDTKDSLYLKLSRMVLDTLNTWHDEIKQEYEAINVNDLAIIHALRIRAKKMRYVMEVFELNQAEDTKEMYKEIKRWQEVLGNITDANRNSAAVMEIAEKYPDAPIQEELRVFNELQDREAALLYEEFFGIRPEPVLEPSFQPIAAKGPTEETPPLETGDPAEALNEETASRETASQKIASQDTAAQGGPAQGQGLTEETEPAKALGDVGSEQDGAVEEAALRSEETPPGAEGEAPLEGEAP